ncbi:MAG: amidohydrolase family protein [Candidatus Rokubacteria bacterium]|nr:amidohydrolase family protein [Candidatus Rokubacteria bacterium]
MSTTVFTNAFLIDCTGAEPVEGAAVVVEDDRIKDVLPNGKVGAVPGPVTTFDLEGATLMPGLTDAHVHICAVTENITDQHRFYPPSYIAARAMRRAEECLMQGFTTVRDAGGADYGFRLALEEGHVPGPRLLVSGQYISQTGGHGDKRRRAEWIAPVDCCLGMVGSIADGEAEVRRAVREQLRRDVNQIKIMASGGAMSPSDELDTTQFTVAEMRAAVEEAQAVGTYVLSHAYSDTAVRNAIAVPRADDGHVRGDLSRRQALRHRRSPDSEDRPRAAAERAGADVRVPGGLQDRLGVGSARRHGEPAPRGARAEGPGDEADGGAAVGDEGERRAVPHVGQNRHRRTREIRRRDRGERQSVEESPLLPAAGESAPHHEGREDLQAAALIAA